MTGVRRLNEVPVTVRAIRYSMTEMVRDFGHLCSAAA